MIKPQVLIEPDADPELYEELLAIPTRKVANRLKQLALIGLLATKGTVVAKEDLRMASDSSATRKAGDGRDGQVEQDSVAASSAVPLSKFIF